MELLPLLTHTCPLSPQLLTPVICNKIMAFCQFWHFSSFKPLTDRADFWYVISFLHVDYCGYDKDLQY